MFKSSGTLRYSQDPIKLVVNVDDNISNYYRSLIPKYIKIQKPMYPAHISVVRKCIPRNMWNWAKYDGLEVSFQYENIIHYDELYFWLNVYSIELESIRTELGLELWGGVSLSCGFNHMFHITISNCK